MVRVLKTVRQKILIIMLVLQILYALSLVEFGISMIVSQ